MFSNKKKYWLIINKWMLWFKKGWSHRIMERLLRFESMQSRCLISYMALHVAASVLETFNKPVVPCICSNKFFMIIPYDSAFLNIGTLIFYMNNRAQFLKKMEPYDHGKCCYAPYKKSHIIALRISFQDKSSPVEPAIENILWQLCIEKFCKGDGLIWSWESVVVPYTRIFDI